ncbi:MAG: DNA mismatch repair protein MutS [Candidatus Methanoperedens sp.]|jgi:DNA mismatch repair protein MutS|nr:DNA mismatch repair protein MutS [Candidatus Methanoperedens sp.]PKL54162.1 MAG: DNA mismatch repair protein MutS [Candidatus Methanoperedenaceae archaeon HGW-Methanoperedenaceae-1]
MNLMTPAMRQYYEAKEKHPDALIFFRMGDFYESFGDDAKTIAKELDITLTARGKGKDGEKMPLAGIPYHAADSYVPRLIKKGYKVAICEQLEDPKKAKGVVKRGVVRVITPGTIIDSSMIHDASNNYLMSVSGEGKEFGVSFLDVSTGEFITTQFTDNNTHDKLISEAVRMKPAECLLPHALFGNKLLRERLENNGTKANEYVSKVYEPADAVRFLTGHFGVATLAGMGCENLPQAISSAAAALEYAKDTQMRDLGHIQAIRTYFESDSMVLDSITLRNLELVQNIRGDSGDATLISIIDRTNTPMGSRTLRKMLLKPLVSAGRINERLDAVDEIVKNTLLRYELRAQLSIIKDVERLIGRIVYGNSNARDLVALRSSLDVLPGITGSMGEYNARTSLLTGIMEKLGDFSNITGLLHRAVMDEPPLSVREGGMIKEGYSEKLDELKDFSLHGKDWIAKMQQQERERTGIKSLKIGYSSVFGYYIDVTKPNLPNVPDNYIRKQTTANGERFYTPELKEKEELILSADEKTRALEFELLNEINSVIAGCAKELQETAAALGELDVLLNLAEIAVNKNYTRPDINDSGKILIRDGRHPVVENSVPDGFVPNDTQVDCEGHQFLLLTGPNMAGKSTYMRQSALIVIMAQMGSFVPASHASIGIVDRIFTRVGAFDDLSSGQSTFMVEMVELANILNNATPKSLLLLDEIGRGTSTYDGYSIAKAVVEYIHNKGRVGVRALFATHYHQLTALEGALKRVKNYHIAVKEEGNDLVFLRKIIPGATDRSYGIHVARLAGVPLKVTQRAKEILADVENESGISRGKSSARYTQLMLFGEGEKSAVSPVLEELKGMDVDAMTPIEALNRLAELKKKACE